MCTVQKGASPESMQQENVVGDYLIQLSNKFSAYSDTRDSFRNSADKLSEETKLYLNNLSFKTTEDNLHALHERVVKAKKDRNLLALSVRERLPNIEFDFQPPRFKTDSLTPEGQAFRNADSYVDYGN